MRAPGILLLIGCVSGATSLDAGTGKVVVLPRRCPGCEVVRNVTVLDADGVRTGRRVMIFDGGIVADEPDDGPVQQVALELDGRGNTLIPGLWDAHVHTMTSDDGFATRDDVPESLKGFVYSGVTSVIDMGGDGKTMAALRARVAAGELNAPHVLAGGRFVTAPAGHPCRTSWLPSVCTPVGPGATPDGVVAELAALPVDLVKVIVEAGGPPSPTFFPRLTRDEIAAITAAAHQRSLKVAAHVSALADLDDALDAGVDLLAHLPAREVMTDAQADLVSARKLPIVTTLSFYEGLPRVLDSPGDFDAQHIVLSVPPAVLATLKSPQIRTFYLTGAGAPFAQAWRAYLVNMKASLSKVKARGGVLLAGSDCGNFAVFHGAGLVRELELLVGAGLTTTEAITAATAAPAEAMGQGAVVGRVRAGHRADLVLVQGDLAADITRLSSPVEVWLSGRRLDRSKLGVARPRSDMVVTPRRHPEDGFCVQDADCMAPLRCHDSRWRCFKACLLANPATCPNGFGCQPRSGSTTDGFCEPTAGCDPLLQNCPFAAAYQSTCVPFEADFTDCWPSGTTTQGSSCVSSSACAQGLVCGDNMLCQQICTPPGGTCPGSTTCMDETARYGRTVGLCR